QRIAEEFMVIVNPAQPGSNEKIVAKNLAPEVLDVFRFRKEAMTADVEEKSLIANGSGDSADVFRVGFKNRDGLVFFGEQISCRQPRRAGANHDCFGSTHGKRLV